MAGRWSCGGGRPASRRVDRKAATRNTQGGTPGRSGLSSHAAWRVTQRLLTGRGWHRSGFGRLGLSSITSHAAHAETTRHALGLGNEDEVHAPQGQGRR